LAKTAHFFRFFTSPTIEAVTASKADFTEEILSTAKKIRILPTARKVIRLSAEI
jgi:hypothetical protein